MSKLLEIPPETEVPWIRTSERLTYGQCEQKWDWAYNDRLEPKRKGYAIRFGSLIHGALESFYRPGIKRGPRPATTFERLYKQELETATKMGYRDEDGEWNDYGELGVAMLTAYYDRYGRDEAWVVLHREHAFHTPVLDQHGHVLFVYVGVLDLVVKDRSYPGTFTAVVDHKSTKDDPTKKADALVLDEQSGAYWTYGVDGLRLQKILKKGIKLDGMIFNFLRKGKPDERKKDEMGRALNNDGTVSKKQPTPLFHREHVYRDKKDGESVRERVMSQFHKMQLLRDGTLHVDKTPGTLHNPHCKWCPFRDMCELHEAKANWELVKKSEFTVWEPYAQHEIEAGDQEA